MGHGLCFILIVSICIYLSGCWGKSESCFGRLLDVHFRAAPLPLQLLTLSPSPGVVPWVWQRKREQSWPCSGHDAGQDLGSNTPNRFGFIRRFWRLEKHSIHSIWFLYLANFSQFYTWSHSHIASYCITTSLACQPGQSLDGVQRLGDQRFNGKNGAYCIPVIRWSLWFVTDIYS